MPDEYISREAMLEHLDRCKQSEDATTLSAAVITALQCFVQSQPTADVAPVRHGRWILEAHDERVNYRWNVTAECSECCDEQKEIWAGFFPNVPPPIARGAAMVSAESVKLSNYCPNCGAKMDGAAE